MPSQREHVRLSQQYLGVVGELQSMGPSFQSLLDAHSREMGPTHRVVDHTFERLNRISELYGPIGYAEILIHLGADFNLFTPLDKTPGQIIDRPIQNTQRSFEF